MTTEDPERPKTHLDPHLVALLNSRQKKKLKGSFRGNPGIRVVVPGKQDPKCELLVRRLLGEGFGVGFRGVVSPNSLFLWI